MPNDCNKTFGGVKWGLKVCGLTVQFINTLQSNVWDNILLGETGKTGTSDGTYNAL
jgi:hypothetical protein